MKNLQMIAHVILVVMGVNVGLGLAGIDIVGMITGMVPMLPLIWTAAVGASGIYLAIKMVTGKNCCK